MHAKHALLFVGIMEYRSLSATGASVGLHVLYLYAFHWIIISLFTPLAVGLQAMLRGWKLSKGIFSGASFLGRMEAISSSVLCINPKQCGRSPICHAD